MSLPQISNAWFTSRTGVMEVARVANSARCLWRETSMHDVGIDGQIEYVDDQRQATGRIILVQVKSGASYFQRADTHHVHYRPESKHRDYWERAPLPVILILHNPETGVTIWTDARQQIRSRRDDAVHIPLDQVFDENAVKRALESEGPLPTRTITTFEAVTAMIEQKHDNPSFPISFFDLFANGMTYVAMSIYFGMDLVMELVETKLLILSSEFSWSMGPYEYDFLDRYVAFLVAQDLARVDFDWFQALKRVHEMVGCFIAPLTSRGRTVIDVIHNVDRPDGNDKRHPVEYVIQERPVSMEFRPYDIQRVAWIERFQREIWPARLRPES